MPKKPKKSKKRSPRRPGPARQSGAADQIGEALRLYQAGDPGGAEGVCSRILEKRPNHADALHLGGVIALQARRYSQAVERLARAVELNPSSSQYHSNLGAAFFEQGDSNAAGECFRKAVALKPNYAEAHGNLGSVLKGQGDLEGACECFQRAIHLLPGFADAHHNLGTVLQEMGKKEDAFECYRKTIELNPGHAMAYRHMGQMLLFQQNQVLEALDCFRKSLKIDPNFVEAQIGLAAAMERSSAINRYVPTLEAELIKCFKSENMPFRNLALPSAVQLKLKYEIDHSVPTAPDQDLALTRRMEEDLLFILFLEKSVNVEPGFELVLTKMRRVLLEANSNEQHIPETEQRLIAALGMQCFNNEYVFSVDSDEFRKAENLKSETESSIEAGVSSVGGLEGKLLLLSMYFPMSSLSCARTLAEISLKEWSPRLRLIMEKTLRDHFEEEAIGSEIGVISSIDDPTSRSVQLQYEENPYPRWLSIPRLKRENFNRRIKGSFPHFSPPPMFNGPVRILVAGCGTGHHPIDLAMSIHSDVLAVDLSRGSLAYAKRMARKIGVDNVEFVQGDILGLSSLDEKFHVIECVGVLHHMEVPEAGLSVLNELLLPGGLIKIGLYSEAARSSILKARERIQAQGLGPRGDDMRSFRSQILMGDSSRDLADLTRRRDFYALSACRDLLFHTKEHNYTLEQIRKMITSQDLAFLGFEFAQPEAKDRYSERFPEDKKMTDFSNWAEMENLHPDTFSNMYQFWCQKSLEPGVS